MSATSVTCPWCKAVSLHPGGSCDRCGGPLPAAPGSDPGQAPPAPPRTLPTAFIRRIKWTSNVFAIIGAVFSIIGIPMFLIFFLVGIFDPFFLIFAFTFGAVFGGSGIVMFRVGRRNAMRKLQALEHGVAADGTVIDVTLDTSESINGRSPWKIHYAFDSVRGTTEGSVKSYDSAAQDRRRGDKVHVVYVTEDPTISSLWPPLI